MRLVAERGSRDQTIARLHARRQIVAELRGLAIEREHLIGELLLLRVHLRPELTLSVPLRDQNPCQRGVVVGSSPVSSLSD